MLLTHTDAPEVFVFDANGESGRKNALSRTDGTQYTAPTGVLARTHGKRGCSVGGVAR